MKKLTKWMILPLVGMIALSSCKKDDDNMNNNNGGNDPLKSATYVYAFNTGQVGAGTAYSGSHAATLTAELKLEEKMDGKTQVTVSLMNTMNGENYMVHAHDAADPSSTPNGTPYNETPNADILVGTIMGNGGTAMYTQESNLSFDQLNETYKGFFVVHDPTQTMSTTDLTTYLVVGAFATNVTDPNLQSMVYNYAFNVGQVAPGTGYMGSHAKDLTAELKIMETVDGKATVMVTLNNTINGEMYMVHAHDAADPNTTPNGTPYDETPNSDILVGSITGNGSSATYSQVSTMDYNDLINNYQGFFVVHDPTQPMSTVDLTTYLVVGSFASDVADPGFKSSTFTYAFNKGQVAAGTAYEGTHADNLMAELTIMEQGNNQSVVMVNLMNTINGETYMVHAHDATDANTTPNGTPYDETPNSDVLVGMIDGNGGSAMYTQVSTMSYDALINTYQGFFVVHDPTQTMSTTDLTTYLVVGGFASNVADLGFQETTFSYDFNTGQVGAGTAYSGSHMGNLTATITVLEQLDNKARVTVTLTNTVNGETYMVHAHDAADANTTPNGTPYNETPNSDVLVGMVNGNGGTATYSQLANMSYSDITTTYNGFFVVHDPLQAMSTVDLTTYLVVGAFAR